MVAEQITSKEKMSGVCPTCFYLRVFTTVPKILSQVVMQMIRHYSEARAVFEGTSGLFSCTSHVFLSTCRYWISLCLPGHTGLLKQAPESDAVSVEYLAELNVNVFHAGCVWSYSKNKRSVRTMRFIDNQTIQSTMCLQNVSLLLYHTSADDVL